MYVYIESESAPHELWTVGHYDPAGKWIAESDHRSRQEAAARVRALNGGSPHDLGDPWDQLLKSIREYAQNNRLTDMDAFCAWKLGLSVWREVQSFGGRFPHQGGAR